MAVSVNSEDVLKVCRILSEAENLCAQVEETNINTISSVVGTASLAGTILGGLKGLFLGVILGATVGFEILAMMQKHKSVTEIIRYNMTSEQKQKLANSVMTAALNVGIEDASELMVLVLTNVSVRRAVMNEMELFFKTKMALHITSC